ncbi:4a-hydroxytetrahydrobiopterin dehydratase [Echinimonas agarilytica]|uniref:Putative pterin-4-alpha-carbinolamine dehydratase n=1 Tax=Echinimonas agarilytica TaxID=1215918 RepID=A0AA42B6C3_9GAMM|nr:4a-hydroxytetrahydrobiopterin dehydratase [Echinimonas agarilytica]
MSGLAQQQCESCRVGAPKVTGSELPQLKSEVPEWQVKDDDGVLKLTRQVNFPNFLEALEFGNEVGALAEEYAHHPAILIEWGSVTVTWWTHKIKGLHKNDFIMAAKTDELLKPLP